LVNDTPQSIQGDFAELNKRTMPSFNGFVNGIYDSKHIPAYNINSISKWFFPIPRSPKPVKNINIALKVDILTDHGSYGLLIFTGHIEMDDAAILISICCSKIQ